MKILRIYIDTSVIGGCCDAEFAIWSNGLMQDFRQGTFRPVLSEVTAAEILPAPEPVRLHYAELLSLGAEMLEVSDESLDVMGVYQMRGVLAPWFRNDMLHIALATVADVDVLVSWNFGMSSGWRRFGSSMPSTWNWGTNLSTFILPVR